MWIDVRKELPELGVPVLVYMAGTKNVFKSCVLDMSVYPNYEPEIFLMARFLRGGSKTKFYWNNIQKGNQLDNRLVTHWQPLPPSPSVLLDKAVDDLNLTIRAVNALKGAGCYFLRDIVRKTEWELLREPNLGHKSLNEIKEMLFANDLCLRGESEIGNGG